jgi:DNA-binding FadR family transcriptional regulator
MTQDHAEGDSADAPNAKEAEGPRMTMDRTSDVSEDERDGRAEDAPRPDRKRSPLVDQVYRRLLAEITSGGVTPGQKLPGELELAGRYLVSRPIVRDALQLLRDEGLIYSRRGSGTFVRSAPAGESALPTPGFAPVESIADIQRCYEFRITLEPESAYWAARRWNEPVLAAIETALHEMRDATRIHTHREDADFNFHCAIAEASNNHYHVSSMNALKEHIGAGMKIHGLSVMGPDTALEGVFAEHTAIFEAIRHRDADKARMLMRLHLEGSRDRVFGGRTLDLSF